MRFYDILTDGFGVIFGERLIHLLKKTYSGSQYAKNIVFLCTAVFVGLTTVAFSDNALPTEPAALDFVNARSLWKADPNLTGKGVLIGSICRSITYINGKPQKDYRFNMNHNSIYDADVLFADGTDGRFGISDHATSIAGILLGLDENATHPDRGTFNYRGACPDASVNVYEFEQFSILHLLGKRPIKEDIILLSLGDIFEDWWTRALEQAAAEKDFLVVASIGNGTDAYTPKPLYPGAGSNVLGVGVVDAVTDTDGNISLQSFSAPKPIHSSIGPTEDHRCKPDIVAPGTALVPAAESANGYQLKTNWSSLAAPIVAGTAALLEQKASSDASLNTAFNQPGKSLVLKAVLMNSARKLPFWHKGQIDPNDDHETPLDYAQGAGLLDGLAAQEQLTAGMEKPGSVKTTGWDNRVLQGEDWGYEYAFEVSDPNQMISATLCWNRAYQSKYPFKHLLEQDADLRLELWGIDPNNPEKQALLDYSDSVNDNVEHIYFACNPDYTAYAIRVRFNEDQPSDASAKQRFAVAWSVGPDRQIGNTWWHDLNEDNAINANDNIIYSLIESEIINRIEMAPLIQTLGISEERLQLLTKGWIIWKPYLSNRDKK